jgi:hypothetical protein
LSTRDKRQQRPGSAGEREKRHGSDQYRAQIPTVDGEAQARVGGARQTLGRRPFSWLPRRAPPQQCSDEYEIAEAFEPEGCGNSKSGDD